MKVQLIVCDTCKKEGRPDIGFIFCSNWITVLYHSSALEEEIEYDFCSKECLNKWVNPLNKGE